MTTITYWLLAMLRPLQSTSSHVSISISIFLLNIHPEFTSGSPRFFRPVHRSLATRLSVVWSSLLRSEHARCFPSLGLCCDGASCRGLPGTLSQQHHAVPGALPLQSPVHSLKLLSTLSAFMGLHFRMCSWWGDSFSRMALSWARNCVR